MRGRGAILARFCPSQAAPHIYYSGRSIGHIMAITITVSDTVGIKVKGTINDAAANPQPFSFGLTCMRLDGDQIEAKLKGNTEASLTDFMADIALGWSDVKEDDGTKSEFSEDALRRLFKIPGTAALSFKTYLTEVGAKEKN